MKLPIQAAPVFNQKQSYASNEGLTPQQNWFGNAACSVVKHYGGCRSYCGGIWSGKVSRIGPCIGACMEKCHDH